MFAQEDRTELGVGFRVDRVTIEQDFSDNTKRLQEIDSFLKEIQQDSTLTILQVSFRGSASPEGSYQLNRKLARGRLDALENIIRHEVEIPDSIITRDDSYISWEYLKEQVSLSNISRKQEVIDIINLEPRLVRYVGDRHIDHRIVKLKSLDGGRIWNQLYKSYFPRMRNARVVFVMNKREIIPAVEPLVPPMTIDVFQKLELGPLAKEQSQESAVMDGWDRSLYLKTNTLGWGLAISNIGAEVDLAKHLSLSVPAYYSALNYFSTTVKFRTLAVQPELRYWFNEDNQKFFVGAHFGYAQYNVAVNGDYRYQDHDGTSPALGGGISVGYRMPISTNDRWHIEFSLGAGVYDLNYDRFYNVENGKLYDTTHKTYWGIDNASVSISYRFDLNKRKK